MTRFLFLCRSTFIARVSVASDLIRRALMRVRGDPMEEVATAPSAPAPVAAMPGLDQAFNAPVNPVQGQTPQSMFAFNPQLEAQGQVEGNVPMNPMITQIMKHLGLLNMIRNRANTEMSAGS